MSSSRKTVAVFFGGPSMEHDVSILSGLQVLEGLDSTKYAGLPVYMSPEGIWYTGDALKDRRNYLLTKETKKRLYRINPRIDSQVRDNPASSLGLRFESCRRRSLFSSKGPRFEASIAIPSLHGGVGENGSLQGFFEVANIPYVGARVLDAAICMDKKFSKSVFQSLGIPTVAGTAIERPLSGAFPDVNDLKKIVKDIDFPCCVKPCHLGSSVGVSRANSIEELQFALASIYKMDNRAIIEKFIPNLVEYNVAVTQALGGVRTSVIERPLTNNSVLNFKDKYLSSGEIDSKLSSPASTELMTKNRVFNPPELSTKQKKSIEDWAKKAFVGLHGRGAVRIDFLCNSQTRDIWINEINTYPGSLAYYLWERADRPVTFTELLTALIEEGFSEHQQRQWSFNPTLGQSDIFKRD